MTATRVRKFICGNTTRCLQADFRMVVEALCGKDPGQEAADTLTGYVEGRGTWQFRTLLALGAFGLNVIDHELFNFEKFTVDPRGAVADQVQDEHVVQLIMDETDVNAEVEAVKRCLRHPSIELLKGIPSELDLLAQVNLGRLVICNVDLRILEGKREREGHFLLVERIEGDEVIAHDPGPKGHLARRFDRSTFFDAWRSPSEAMANYIAVWR